MLSTGKLHKRILVEIRFYKDVELPNVTGSLQNSDHWNLPNASASGAFVTQKWGCFDTTRTIYSTSLGGWDFALSNVSSIYKAGATVQPKALNTQYLIKY